VAHQSVFPLEVGKNTKFSATMPLDLAAKLRGLQLEKELGLGKTR
jgi:hypothetical protein